MCREKDEEEEKEANAGPDDGLPKAVEEEEEEVALERRPGGRDTSGFGISIIVSLGLPPPTGMALKDEEEEKEGCELASGTEEEMAARGG